MKIGQIVIDLTLSNIDKVMDFLRTLSPGDFTQEGEPLTEVVTDTTTNAPGGPAPTPAPPIGLEVDQVTSEAPAPPANTGIELDKNGIPWDERIHAGTKTKNADGTWRNMRGVDKDLLARVEAELKAAAAPSPGPQPAGPPAPQEQNISPGSQAGGVNDQNDATAPAAQKDYMYVVQRIGSIDPKQLQAALSEHGLNALPELYNRPEVVPIICEKLGI